MADFREMFRKVLREEGAEAVLWVLSGFGVFVLHPVWVGLVLLFLVGMGILLSLAGGVRMMLVLLLLFALFLPAIVKAVLWVASLVGVIILLVALGKTMDFVSTYRKRLDFGMSKDLWFFREKYRQMMVERAWLKRILLALMIDLAAVIPLYGITFLAQSFSQTIAIELKVAVCVFGAASGLAALGLAILMARHTDRAARDRPTLMLFALTAIVMLSFGLLFWLGGAEGSAWLQLPHRHVMPWAP